MQEHEIQDLRRAVELLEYPTFVSRLTSLLGKPLEWAGRKMSPGASEVISRATIHALQRALNVACLTMNNKPREASEQWHKLMVLASGAAGGALGLSALPIELPLSTVIMLRSIADIARSEGEDIRTPNSALACIEVFALGARQNAEEGQASAYFAIRMLLTRTTVEAAEFIAEKGFVEEGAPVLIKFIAQVASRFGVVVTDKVAAQSIPVVGAAGGAAINYAFIDHFQDVARGHFIVRRLEKLYGTTHVREAYDRIRSDMLTT